MRHGRATALLSLSIASASLSGVLPARAQSPAPVPWDVGRWNPQSTAGDFPLPLPCGGAIALREVDIPAGASPLDDRRIVLGSPELDLGYNEFQRNEYIAGGFQASPQARRYWIGKYEVTRDQYDAVMRDTCPAAGPGSRLPQADVSWFDAVQFGERLTVWLMANARAKLPVQDGVTGFVRLPTEAEWEYAARGGAAVSETEFLAPTFPMPEGADAYVMAGSQRAGNRAQAIGQLRPNPLGLYDILGNVGEMVLEPYRLNHVGRDHGLAGGVIVKGGDYGSQPDDLRTSQRVELPPFDPRTGQPNKQPRVGFRIALGVTATTSLPQTERLRAAFASESSTRQAETLRADNNAQSALAVLRDHSSDPATQAAIRRIEAQMAADQSARAEQQRELTRGQIENMAALAYSSQQLAERAKMAEDYMATPAVRAQFSENEQTAMKANIANFRRMSSALMDSYLGTLRQISENVPHGVAAEQLGIVRNQLESRRMVLYIAYIGTIEHHLRAAQLGHVPTLENVRTDLAAAAAEAFRNLRTP